MAAGSATVKLLLSMFTWLIMSCYYVDGATKEDAYNLHHYLFHDYGYKKDIRPIENDTGKVYVYLGFALFSVVDVEEKEQKLVTTARLEFQWFDPWLTWDPSNYGGLSYVLVKQEDIWVPDVIVGNSVTLHNQLGFDELLVRVSWDGVIYWDPTSVISTSCDIDVTFYPFDTQVCSITFETAMSTHEEVRIFIDEEEPVILRSYNKDGQWSLLDTSEQNLEADYGKTKIRFSLLLQRRRLFYVVNIIIPVVFLSLTATLVFALPPETGEKMGVSLTVLLAYAVYLSLVSGHLPSTSSRTSLLNLYLTILLGITAASVVLSGLILRMYYRPPSKQVGPKMAKITRCLKIFMCTSKKVDGRRPRSKAPPPEDEEQKTENSISDKSTAPSSSPSDPSSSADLDLVTWAAVARTLDWFLFVVFSSLNILVTVGGLSIMAIGAAVYSPSLPVDTNSSVMLD